ncbi:GDSL-type esterase/lipase family protein [uncultured Croceitalea sp.]|uniref:GDSL-type esterase/lipase family protein n=1 Tax=uncultured Croceitalea sp. TaxID=1798908 RepID=UPI0033057A2E
MMNKVVFVFFFFLALVQVYGQSGFQKEVDAIVKRNDSLWDSSKETVVFAGSSSIRFWKDVQERFPDYQILNAGFGGSQTSDLLYYLDKLVLRYKPIKIFIYEGDNDISAKKRPQQIIKTTERVLNEIKSVLPSAEIVLISAKPSISRWKFKGKYKRLNKRFSKIAAISEMVFYANVWDIMLNGKKVRQDIFVEDGLHMNKIGYNLWYQQIKPFLP